MNLHDLFISDLRSFDRSVWMFLAATTLNGLVMSIRALIFNFFILSLGFDREFLGLVNALAPASALVMGIPLGIWMDRVGERRAMMVGLALTGLGIGGQVLSGQPGAILVFGFIMGAGNLLFTLSQAPFLVRSTQGEMRIKLLSANFGLFMLAGLVGYILGGQLTVFVEQMMRFPLKSALNYQAVLLIAAALEWVALIPLVWMKEKKNTPMQVFNPKTNLMSLLTHTFVQQLFLIEFLVGIGASVLLPYMNLYFSERFGFSEQWIGVIIGSSSFLTGLASFGAPRIVRFYKFRMHALVTNQSISNFFLLILAFTPVGWVAALLYLLRDLFMKTGSPIFESFYLENVGEHERGMMSSIVRFAFTGGSAIGPYVSGWVQNRAGFSPLFFIMLGFYGVSTFLLWLFFWNFER